MKAGDIVSGRTCTLHVQEIRFDPQYYIHRSKQTNKGKNKGEIKLNKRTARRRGMETSVIKVRKEQETKTIW